MLETWKGFVLARAVAGGLMRALETERLSLLGV